MEAADPAGPTAGSGFDNGEREFLKQRLAKFEKVIARGKKNTDRAVMVHARDQRARLKARLEQLAELEAVHARHRQAELAMAEALREQEQAVIELAEYERSQLLDGHDESHHG